MARWAYEHIVDDAIERFCRRSKVRPKPDAELTYRIERIDAELGSTGRRMHVAIDFESEEGDVWLCFVIFAAWDGGEPIVQDISAVRPDPEGDGMDVLSWADDAGLWEPLAGGVRPARS